MASFELTCNSDFPVSGMQDGEQLVTVIRTASTFISVTVTSAWFSRMKVKRLTLFFAHWLSGLVLGVCFTLENVMVTLCWTSRDLEGFIKTIKFIEQSASNMLAITNLAISVNLALIILSHRTVSRVKSVSSPPLILMFLAISMGIASVSIPFWELILVLGTSFWLTSTNEAEYHFINVSMFYVEFLVGICMFAIVAWLLLCRKREVKECWKVHRRIRYYFGLTALGTAVNLSLGICGTTFVLTNESQPLLLIWSWIFRYMHIALDTIVLYGVLGERERIMDERGDGARSESDLVVLSSGQTKPSTRQLRPAQRAGNSRGSRVTNNTNSKPVASAPLM